MTTKKETADDTKERIFTKGSIISAVLGGLIFLVWAFISMRLPWSSFRIAFLNDENVTEFVSRITPIFFMGGLFTGFVVFHIWKSVKRKEIFKWMGIVSLCSVVIGFLYAATTEVPPTFEALWPHRTFGQGRTLYTVQILARFLVLSASAATVLTSSKRRTLLKAVGVPLSLGITVRVILLSFVPVKTDFFNRPWEVVDALISTPTGIEVGILIFFALILVVVRKFRQKPEDNQ